MAVIGRSLVVTVKTRSIVMPRRRGVSTRRLQACVQWKVPMIRPCNVARRNIGGGVTSANPDSSFELVFAPAINGRVVVRRPSDGAILRIVTPSATPGNHHRITILPDLADVFYQVNEHRDLLRMINVHSSVDGALLREVPILPKISDFTLALDAARNLVYVATEDDDDSLLLKVHRASDGEHLRTVMLPATKPENYCLVVEPSTGDLFVVALVQEKYRRVVETLVYSGDGGVSSSLARRLAAFCVDGFTVCAALDVHGGDLLYIAHRVTRHFRTNFCISVVRTCDGRRLAVIEGLLHTTSLCATPTALVACYHFNDAVVSLQPPARLRWRPDADVHPLFDEDEEDATGKDGGSFHCAVAVALALAVCRSVPQQLHRLPLELLCMAFAQLAPVVLDGAETTSK